MKNLIFIVEDEENIAELIAATLKSAGFESRSFYNANDFFNAIEKEIPNLVILDYMLPDISGLSILKNLKRIDKFKELPVIFLTAKSGELDKVECLDYGADDYIVKPFGILELISRTKAVLRRYSHSYDSIENIWFRDIEINLSEKNVSKNSENLNLTYKEYELLLYLYKNKGITLSREQILENVWGYSYDGGSRTVDSHIKSLRHKLGQDDENIYICTIRGHGYMLIKE